MKHTIQQRDIDFMNAIRTALDDWDDNRLPSIGAIIRRATAGPAPRFYTDFKTAYNTITRMHLTGLPRCINSNKQQMWIDLATLVFDYMNTHHGCTIAYALAHVLENQPAPSFYLSVTTARAIYYRFVRQQADQNKEIA